MTPEQVAAILAARTPGRWFARQDALQREWGQQVGNPGKYRYLAIGKKRDPEVATTVLLAADARAIVTAVNLAEPLLAVAEAARDYSPQLDHDWRCEYRTAEAGWQPGDSPVIRCECGYDELQRALAALDTAMQEEA